MAEFNDDSWKTPKALMAGPKMQEILRKNAERAWRRENEPGYAEWHQKFVIEPSEKMDREWKDAEMGTILRRIPILLGRARVPSGFREMTQPDDNQAITRAKEWLNAYRDAVATQSDGKYSLLLLGRPGTGKTVAAVYILRQQLIRYASLSKSTGDERDDCLFISASELADIGSFDSGDRDFYERTKSCRTLILDDLGSESLKDASLARFEGLLVERFSKFRPTIITSNLSKADFKERYGERISGRIREFAMVFEVNDKDMRRAQ